MATMPTPAEIEEQMLHISDNMVPSIITVNVVCLTIACIAVALRFQARRMIRIRYEADDWLILVGLFFTIGLITCAFLGVRYGAGRHAILIKNPPALAKVVLTGEVIWGFAITATKGSILYLYYRVFYVDRKFVLALKVVGIFVVCYCLVQSFASIFQCLPVDSNWKVGINHYCVNTDLGATVIAAVNVFTDFVMLIMPMPLVYKLQKPMRQRLQIMGVFCLGGLVCFASIYRTILTHEFSRTDPSWSDTRPEIWSVVELCFGILSACLPTMRPLITRQAKSTSSSAIEHGKERSESSGGSSDQSLSQHGGSSRSLPSESQHFAHLGVLANADHVEDGAPAKW